MNLRKDEAGSVSDPIVRRAEVLFREHRSQSHANIDRMFAGLMAVQWVFGILVAVFISPFGWAGKVQTTHFHVYAAVFVGGAISSLPILLALSRPGWVGTRYVIACAQMLWSALLIHLMGGRIETHFHVFGSLAFLSFYREWKVLVPATVVVAADHMFRQIYWPESVFGVVNPESWRFLEHALWVVFEDSVLVLACLRGTAEMRTVATRQAEVEALSESERLRARELQKSQEALLRSEKLAAVGQLAASVGHELRNPFTAVKNANSYIAKRLGDPKTAAEAVNDPKILQFVALIDRELGVCSKIVGDLLDFARERPPSLQPCPLHPLVDEAIGLLPPHKTRVRNEVPDQLPVPKIDREQFRQIMINLVQNAVEAVPADREGEVVVTAEGGEQQPWRITVSDNGSGMPSDRVEKIFEPLFTTKMRGTGLGLAIVANIVKLHGGTISVDSQEGRGTRIHIDLPVTVQQQAA